LGSDVIIKFGPLNGSFVFTHAEIEKIGGLKALDAGTMMSSDVPLKNIALPALPKRSVVGIAPKTVPL